TQNNLANAYSDRIRGERAENLEQAIAAFEAALQVRTRSAFPQDWAMTQNNLANAYRYRIRGERAENLEQAIAAYQAALEIHQPDTFPADCRSTAYNLGNLYTEDRRWEEASTSYRLALEATENLYRRSFSLKGKEAELATVQDLPRHAAYALARASRLSEAVLTVEQGRARQTSETIARERTNLEQVQTLAPELYHSYQQAATQLRQLEDQNRIASLHQTSNSPNVTPETNRQQILQARQKLDEAIESIRSLPGYENFLAAPTLDDISRSLQSHESLVYLIAVDEGSLALLVSTSSTNTEPTIEPIWLDAFQLADLRMLLLGEEEKKELAGWFGAYNNRKDNQQKWWEELDRVTGQLWLPVMQPILHRLKELEMQKAILIPTGAFGLLPLHAAWTEDTTQPSGRRYALDELCLTYAPNARTLASARETVAKTLPDSILAVSNPNKDLPNSELEVREAVTSFANHQVFPHEQATREAVKSVLSDYTVYHFSCHGYANFAEPLNSGLSMAGNEFLTLNDLFALRLPGARLAVLSACETGLPGGRVIDEAVSLPTGMLQAGIAGVVASLWAVLERETTMLMIRFYELWRCQNLDPPEALRQAQQWMRDTTNQEKIDYFQSCCSESATTGITPETARSLYRSIRFTPPQNRDFAHPFYWAAFGYTGI
ncbi:CHAT domain-containing protein, partial [Geitlerinema sp. PCC 9228]|uniref:CHAT domain-containing protein n=1 Tax=Geitlerinema sp. PCC 9228 TaxID=111611 RepID=UPI0011147851